MRESSPHLPPTSARDWSFPGRVLVLESDRMIGQLVVEWLQMSGYQALCASDTATLLQNSSERSETHTIAVDVPAEPVWLQADEGQIRQIVWNLATNGLRAMPEGGELTLSVESGEAAHAGELTLAVRDEGVGIPANELESILQPFRGGFSKGTGLGLSIVHRIVSDYGGELQVDSEPGVGTTVKVKLPLAAEVAVATAVN